MFVSLGTGRNQIPLLLAIRNLGFPVIGIDRDANSDGRRYCDYFLEVSIYDEERILKELDRFRRYIDGIYTRSFGKAISIANRVAKEMDLPHNPQESVEFFQDKKKVLFTVITRKELEMQRKKIENLIENDMWVVKPKDAYENYAKRNIFLEEDRKKIREYLTRDSYVVEPYYEGNEYIFFGIVIDRQLYPLMVTQKEKIENGDLLFCDYSHIYPSDLEAGVKYRMFLVVDYLVKTSGYRFGPVLAEFLYNKKEDAIYFLESAIETGGEFIADYMFPEVLRIPYFEILVKLYSRNLQQQAKESIKKLLYRKLEEPKETAMVIQFLLQKEGFFRNLVFPEELFSSPYYYTHARLIKNNSYTSLKNRNKDRLGYFVLAGRTSPRHLKEEKEKILKHILIEYS